VCSRTLHKSSPVHTSVCTEMISNKTLQILRSFMDLGNLIGVINFTLDIKNNRIVRDRNKRAKKRHRIITISTSVILSIFVICWMIQTSWSYSRKSTFVLSATLVCSFVIGLWTQVFWITRGPSLIVMFNALLNFNQFQGKKSSN